MGRTREVFGRSYPIKNVTAFISMIFAGLLILLFGLGINNIFIGFDGVEITPYTLLAISIVVVLLTWFELGFKLWKDWSDLSRFSNQQLFTLFVSFAVLFSSLFNAFLVNPPSWLLGFNGGAFIASGAVIILEALR